MGEPRAEASSPDNAALIEAAEVIMQLPPDLAQVLAERRGETIEDIDTTYKVIEDEVT